MSDKSPFTDHEIVSRVEAEGFGSWLMKRRRDDGSLTGTFWVRITAANGLLTVVGDIDPTVFAYGPIDPLACVRWIGCKSSDDNYYPIQKAAIGMGGRDKISEWDTDLARAQLREMLAEAKAERETEAEEFGHEVKSLVAASTFEQALQAGLDVPDEYGGRTGVDAIIMAVLEIDSSAAEDVGHVGRKVAPSVVLAIQALNQLVKLLDAEAGATEAA